MGQRGNLTKRDAATGAVTRPVRGEENFGPAMSALNERQQRFVVYLLETGSNNHTEAARVAGYAAENNESLRATAYRVAHSANVQNAMREESERRMRGAAIMATTRLVEIANNPKHKDQLKAIGMVLDRVGLHGKTEQAITVEHKMSDSEMRARILTLCADMGIDPAKMLGQSAPKPMAIEAEYTEVETVPVP